MKDFINKINNKEDLTLNEMQEAINLIMSGMSDDDDIESFLIGLNEKGVSETEVTAAAIVMKEKSLKFDIGDGSHIDTCGTGGTGLHTFNCSTASSFVAAAAGAKITKHGNKAISSKSGSADFLAQSGANINHERKKLISIFDQVGFVFLFAPLHHQAMKYVMPARQKIAQKTIFNLLGPLSNPAFVKRQMVGVFDKRWLLPFAEALKKMGSTNAWIIHGRDGLDEVSISEITDVVELKKGKISEFSLDPSFYGFEKKDLETIKGGDPKYNAIELKELLNGKEGPYKDIVLLNSAAAIYISGKVANLQAGINLSLIHI